METRTGDKQQALNLSGKKIVVVGLGRTGQALVDFLLGQGARVIGTDVQTSDQLGEPVQRLTQAGAFLELGGHRVETFITADLIILSPGVPPTFEALIKAKARGVPITGEIELAASFIQAPMVAVTGTNGKTTTTSLIGAIFAAAGLKTFVGGNIGSPLIGLVHSDQPVDMVVIEVSSFQLETTDSFRPNVAVLLNITPDHLDRYTTYEEYRQAKINIFARQTEADWAILNADDFLINDLTLRPRTLWFSREKVQDNGAVVQEEDIVVRREGQVVGKLPLAQLTLEGAHNQENVMAALLAAMAMGVDLEVAARAVSTFKGLSHRVEAVGEFGGVRYYDDSKGTNVGAVIKSLEGFQAPIILIAGGRDKAGDFQALKPLVREKVKLLILLGEAKNIIAEVLSGETETVLVQDMAEAVRLAKSRAVPGDVVLLSPACASFDMFTDYGHRGRVFTEAVREIAGR